MTVTPQLFEAFLSCQTKCWLRAANEAPTGNEYAQWCAARGDRYRADEVERLSANKRAGECLVAPTVETMKSTACLLTVDVPARAANVETRIAAVERVPSAGRGKPSQFIPIRFAWPNKLGRHEKLMLALDALALAETFGHDVPVGKIVHGDDHATLKVKLPALVNEARKLVEKTAALLSNASPPDLVLNRHCAECEFQVRCREKAIEKDDLSLLAGMTEKERKKYHSKGIFTITQLSYTFRPRRRPKRLRDRREKYHHALKALAIREKKIHIVGTPELKIDGTPVYFDVEGLPDRDSYYLIGVRIGNGDAAVQHSLWADTVADERRIWHEFLAILATVEKPVLIHYGSYETVYLRRMRERYGAPPEGSPVSMAIESACNILSVIFARVYFPVFSNRLKDIAGWLDFTWPEGLTEGAETITRREHWAEHRVPETKLQLTRYNVCDCEALDLIAKTLLGMQRLNLGAQTDPEVFDVTSVKREHPFGFKRNTWAMPELDSINKAAYWDYQRERVYVRSNRQLRNVVQRRVLRATGIQPNRVVQCPRPRCCPHCSSAHVVKHGKARKLVYDLKFTSAGLKRWVVHYDFHYYWCRDCDHMFYPPEREWSPSKFGSDLIAYSIYQIIELRMPMETVIRSLNRLFGVRLASHAAHDFKKNAAKTYAETYEAILTKLKTGSLIHADETKVSVGGSDAFVWVFTSMEEVAYVFAETREAAPMQTLLKDFKGVLVSDFFAAYEGLKCPQQKCLVHLIRDLNDALHKHPFDDDLKRLASGFTFLLRPIVETVDRFGLKCRFLRKHRAPTARFFKLLSADEPRSEVAMKLRTRLEKHREHLFTFLEHDGVPWNNNNAEHAIKPLAKLRHIFNGVTTVDGLKNYLVLLSVCETCKYSGVDFLDFLRSGEKDVHAFAESRRRRRSTKEKPPPADASVTDTLAVATKVDSPASPP
jgi:predicted RecB family nuclease